MYSITRLESDGDPPQGIPGPNNLIAFYKRFIRNTFNVKRTIHEYNIYVGLLWVKLSKVYFLLYMVNIVLLSIMTKCPP